MSTYRFQTLQTLLGRTPLKVDPPSNKVSEFYGESVFNVDAMKKHLTDDAYDSVMEAIKNGDRIDRKMADQVAAGMREWALSKGATHYTHWFQPLTGRTAEKHDAFFEPAEGGRAIERFGGSQLVQQEPDASSLPSGGIRNTFEARGYTAWDPTSPAFIFGKTLCIPTVFVSYTGEALDFKTPLLNSISVLDKAAVAVCQYFDKNVSKVTATLGWEQEYFLIDYALYTARPDIALTGRTLFGHSSSKGQQLDDHYFGSIHDRAVAFMKELEIESHKLGIPVKTRHNEVAPNQFECAPVFEEVNLAVDHNQLIMDVMEKVGRKHNFYVALHEKPFAGMNGSGKHNNWSMATDTGVNLLSPGKTPKTNFRFLTFFVNTLKAVHDYADLIRASIASAGNDHRLGANEAPPAIISAFIGSELTSILDEIEKTVKPGKMTPDEKSQLKLRVGRIPDILLDNTDRNRTSPFAFTGNKFELRAVGSTANCAGTMTVLNTVMAKQLRDFKKEVDALIKSGQKKDDAIFSILKRYIIESKNIRFEGNGYGDAWVKEAEKRGLSNVKTTPHALDFFLDKKVKDLFKATKVLTPTELEARYEILNENYKLKVQIESRVIGDIAINHIIPAAFQYQNMLLENVKGMKDVFGDQYQELAETQIEELREVSERVNRIKKLVYEMVEERKIANKIEDASKQAKQYCEKVFPFFEKIRYEVDKLEIVIDDNLWPLPKYRELLFAK